MAWAYCLAPQWIIAPLTIIALVFVLNKYRPNIFFKPVSVAQNPNLSAYFFYQWCGRDKVCLFLYPLYPLVYYATESLSETQFSKEKSVYYDVCNSSLLCPTPTHTRIINKLELPTKPLGHRGHLDLHPWDAVRFPYHVTYLLLQ